MFDVWLNILRRERFNQILLESIEVLDISNKLWNDKFSRNKNYIKHPGDEIIWGNRSDIYRAWFDSNTEENMLRNS